MKVLACLGPDPELHPRGPPLSSEMVPINTGLIEMQGVGWSQG